MASAVSIKAAVADENASFRAAKCRCRSTRQVLPITAAVLAAVLTGCGLPASAPTSLELLSNSYSSDPGYVVVKVDRGVAQVLAKQFTSFGSTFQNSHYIPTDALRAGDAIAITIYEAGGSSLFPPPPSSSAPASSPSTMGSLGAMQTSLQIPPPSPASAVNSIPPQIIEADGTIEMPFVGRMQVAGLNPAQVGTGIERALRGKAVAPQVVVTLATNVTNTATVGGEVNSARLVPLSLRGERLLDLIAAAGGPKYPAYESYVEVIRSPTVGKMLLQTVVSDPAENIVIKPNDQIYLTRNPRTYVVLGATQHPAVFPFDREKISLAEGIAMAGGSMDFYGDPSGIYLFRYEPWRIAKLVMDPVNVNSLGASSPEFVPIIYHLNLRDAESYFLAQAIQIRDKDVILVTNAASVQLTKLLVLVRGFTGIACDLRATCGLP